MVQLGQFFERKTGFGDVETTAQTVRTARESWSREFSERDHCFLTHDHRQSTLLKNRHERVTGKPLDHDVLIA